MKPTNPKDALGSNKIPFHLWPETASAEGAIAMLDGALKYGRMNYRPGGARASIYADAARRHINAWFEGQDADLETGVSHLGYALACLAILVDSRAAGTLVDDRNVPGRYLELVEQLTEQVHLLKALHVGRKPRHFTIADKKRSR